MHVAQSIWTQNRGWQHFRGDADLDHAALVLYFAAPGSLDDGLRLGELRARYPSAHLVGCTTGGEILGDMVHDDSIVVTALQFDHSTVRTASRALGGRQHSFAVGAALAAELATDRALKGVFVLSDGTQVNGSDLVRGFKSALPEGTVLTGGLAGDGDRFASTQVGADGPPQAGMVVAVGLYGENLRLHHGSFGGWDAFGPERLITRSNENVLYELDGEPALALYKRYLGDEAKHLPSSGLLFPLRIRPPHDRSTDLVRTVAGIDEESGAMIFAGDVPNGYSAQMMRGNFEHLMEGAGQAARQATEHGGGSLAILISCIGRKLLLGQRTGDEIETVCEILGENCRTIGFYSYGEICPHDFTSSCELHNQTMTITLIDET